MTELVDSVPEDQKRAVGLRPGPRRGARDECREPATLRRGVNAVLLSLFFPGVGHLYAGRASRGVVWSAVFVGLVLPTALFAFVVLGSFGPAALARIAVVFLGLLVVCALGAFRSVSRRRSPPLGILGLHAAGVTFITAIEVIWFLRTFLGSSPVQTGRLEPILSRGEEVTVAYSQYVRPVHGDIVLFSGPGNRVVLGRVLAKPRDRMELRGGDLLVNNIELDLLRRDQRRDLERAGRMDRRRRILPGQRAPDASGDGRVFLLSGEDWGPYTVPDGRLLVIPDEVMGTPGDAPSAVLIPESTLRGRVIGS